MRELKFRVWNGYRMLSDETLRKNAKKMYTRLGTRSQYMGDIMIPNNEGLVVMQYTGLKDKNGKEIYEGDIVEFMHSGEKHISVIYYKELEGFHFKFTYENYRYDFSVSDLKVPHRKTLVIGNIYKNPELLRVE